MKPACTDPAPTTLPAVAVALDADTSPSSPFKGSDDLGRLARAAGYSWQGVRAAWRHEAAFRLEVVLGVPMLAYAAWAAPGRWHALALALSVLAVWIVELLNSALEAVADAVSIEAHPLIGRAKDMGSAAVTTSLLALLLTWAVVFWP